MACARRTRFFQELSEKPSSVVPAAIMRWAGTVVSFLVRLLAGAMQEKYPAPYDADVVRGKLQTIRRTLQQREWTYILETFSYAGAARLARLLRPYSGTAQYLSVTV